MINSIRDAKDILQLIGAFLILIPAIAIFLRPVRTRLGDFLGELFTGKIEKKMIEKLAEVGTEISKLRSTQISQHRANIKGRKILEKEVLDIKAVTLATENLIEEHISEKGLHNT